MEFGSFDDSSVDEIQDSDAPTQLVRSSAVVGAEQILAADSVGDDALPGCSVLSNARVQLQRFALTFPRCDVLPSVALQAILDKQEVAACGIKQLLVCREPHQDGTPHLHVFLVLKKQLKYRLGNNDFWDFVGGKHGNYQAMKSVRGWLNYCMKGEDYVCFPPEFVPSTLLSASKHKVSYVREDVAKKIREDPETEDKTLVDLYPGFMLMYGDKVDSFRERIRRLKEAERIRLELPLEMPLCYYGFSDEEKRIYMFFHRVSTGGRTHQHHLRIEGGTGIGKTRLMKLLSFFFNLYHVDYETNWFDDFSHESADLIVFDEFKSQKKLNFINRLCDGSGAVLSRRGKAPYRLKYRVPIIICSNFSWDQSYPNVLVRSPVLLEAAGRRFLTVRVPLGGNLFRLCDMITALIRSQSEESLDLLNDL